MNERIEARKQILIKTDWRTAIFTGLTYIVSINKIRGIKMFIPNSNWLKLEIISYQQ